MTDPTAESAKLPAELTEEDRSIFDVVMSYLRNLNPGAPYLGDRAVEIIQLVRATTRPQPAPPAGEPQIATAHFHGQPRKLSVVLHALAAQENNNGDEGNVMQAAGDYIAGLSARPKVEDAEVAAVVLLMRSRRVATSALGSPLETVPDHDCHKAADLLERLVGEREEWNQLYNIEYVARRLESEATKAAESKLAEREAALAKADAMYHKHIANPGGWKTTHEEAQIQSEILTRHAARQKQKASDEPRGERE